MLFFLFPQIPAFCKILSFYFSLYLEGSSASRRSLGTYAVCGDPLIFLLSHGKNFSWDGSGKLKNTREKGTNQENSKKEDGKNGGKKKERLLHSWRFSYSCVLHRSATPRATALVRPSGEAT